MIVAAGILPAVEPGFQPGGMVPAIKKRLKIAAYSELLPCAVYVRQNAGRYNRRPPTL